MRRSSSWCARVFRMSVIAALLVALGGFALATPAAAEGPNAIVEVPNAGGANACVANVLPRNDDGSTTAVGLPTTINFFGRTFGAVFVNNNGNVTFTAPLGTFTPFNLLSTGTPIIAPFFADVDTRGALSNEVRFSGRTFGHGTFAGRPTFCANWVNVGYFSGHTDKLNSFQLLIVDRGDVASGDFDILFNYDKIQWETGDASGGSGGLGGSPARAGFSNGLSGTGGRALELTGSGVRGGFLDSNITTGLIHSNRGTFQPGRYVFEVRNGVAPTGGGIGGIVSTNPPVAGSFVQVCSAATLICNTTSTNATGSYEVAGLGSGAYSITAFAPTGSNLNRETIQRTLETDTTRITNANIVLRGPEPLPNGTTITNRYVNAAGTPVLYWGDTLTLATTGCAGGAATHRVILGTADISSGGMTETPAGVYTATIAPLRPNSGLARVEITIVCGGVPTTIGFDVYIDPSGNVRTTTGEPIAGATVTLYRSDSSSGPFVQVPDGSGLMSPMNRTNPDTTDASGHFGWDVIAGFYRVRASATDCVSPTDASQPFVETAVLTIPPPVTDLDLRLDCPSTNSSPTANAGGPYSAPEGGSVALSGSGTDPDQGQTLTYAWDLDDDGTFETDGSTASFSAATIDGPATRTVTFQACDSATPSLCATANALVTIGNVAPAVTATNDGPNFWGLPIGFTGTASDPSPADTSAGFTSVWDFGDGSSGSGMTATHTYATPGAYTASFTATDKDGGTSSPGTTVATVNKRATTLSCTAPNHTFGFGTIVTATLRDSVDAASALLAGNTIAFASAPGSASGTTNAAGSASGTISLLMPGTHTVTATFAGSDLYTGATATCGVILSNSAGKVTGGLDVGGFNVQSDGANLKGSLTFETGATTFEVRTMKALGISTDRKSAWFAGVGTDGRTFVAYVEDNGEPPITDVFRLWIDGVLQAGAGTMTEGNIQIHK